MLWSGEAVDLLGVPGCSDGARAASTLLSGAGVVVRLVDQGLMESTAELKYDFSVFLSMGAGGILDGQAPNDSHAALLITFLFATLKPRADRVRCLACRKNLVPTRGSSVVKCAASIRPICNRYCSLMWPVDRLASGDWLGKSIWERAGVDRQLRMMTSGSEWYR